MRAARTLTWMGLLLTTTCLQEALACGGYGGAQLRRDAEIAVNTSCSRSRATGIAHLREAGPAGLEALFIRWAKEIAAHQADPKAKVENWELISAALNQVGAQYDCHASRLYWHTSLDEAKAAAQESGKPILSLRMLGNLTEECSCANSRFFRSTLYANEQVSKQLRERFVLHWQSVRPVPKVTIDFGDGRKLERTLTGNSIHYVLDAEGRPVEAIPGLYGPQAFLRQLANGQALVQALAKAGAGRDEMLKNEHKRRRDQMLAAWIGDLERLGIQIPGGNSPATAANALRNARFQPSYGQVPLPNGTQPGGPVASFPTAAVAARLAVGKGDIESPLIAAVTRRQLLAASTSPSELEKATTEEIWAKIAALHGEDATLDAGARRLIAEHNPTALAAAPVVRTKSKVESPMLRLVLNLQNSIALDTVRNEYLYHTRISEWFAAGEKTTTDVAQLNKRIYAELFLTPDADPWLGLVSEDVYTGIRDGGLRR